MNDNQKHIDVKLIKAYQAGDKTAMTLLVKRWHIEFCKKAYWLVKDADMSKDIAQECWRTIIDKLHTLENPSSFKPWAFRIVYSKSIDVLRQQSRKRNKELEINQNQNISVEEDQDTTHLKDALLNAIQQLPRQQQIVIRLFYTEEYSLKEISELLEISLGTTKSRLFHAREQLKKIIQQNKLYYEN